jgi:hypothetical protein
MYINLMNEACGNDFSQSGEQQISSLRRRPFAASFIHVKAWGGLGRRMIWRVKNRFLQ